jgi:hypothetical protein
MMPADRRSAHLRTAATGGMSNRRAVLRGWQAARRSAHAADQNRNHRRGATKSNPNDSKSIDRFFVIPAKVGIFAVKLRRSALDPHPLILISVIPAKAGTRDFSRLLLGPRFRGDDEVARTDNFLTASSAGVTVNGGAAVIDTLA